ncbi:hypothetical protein D3C80_1757130 [compost metagenome]
MMLSNKTKPWSRVRKNEFSSSLITIEQSAFCEVISGNEPPICALKVSTNLYIKGSFVFKNVKP